MVKWNILSEATVYRHDFVEMLFRRRKQFLRLLSKAGRGKFRQHIPMSVSEKVALTLYKSYLATYDLQLLEGAVGFMEASEKRFQRKTSRRFRFQKSIESIVEVKGWAAHLEQISFSRQFFVSPDPRRIEIKTGIPRPDVAAAHNDPRLLKSGFELELRFENLPERIELKAEVAGCEIDLVPTTVVSKRYGEFLTEVIGQHPPLIGYIDTVDFYQKSRRRFKIEKTQPEQRLAALSIPLLELKSILGWRVQVDESFRMAGSRLPQPSSDFRIDRLRFSTSDLIDQKNPTFRELSWRPIEALGEVVRSEVILAQPVLAGSTAENHDDRIFKVSLRVPKVQVLRDVVHLHGHLILDSNGELVVADHSARPDLDFVAGQWDIVHGSHLRRDRAAVLKWGKPTIEIDRAASITGRVGFNYFHSMVEYLPRLITLERNSINGDVPLIVNADLLPTARDALHRIAADWEIVELRRNDVARFESLLVPNHHTDHRDSTVEPWWKGAGMYWPVINEFRNRLIGTVTHQQTPERVFFIRSTDSVNGRGLRNQDELLQIAEQFGFVSIDPGKMDLDSQINIVRNAEILVGPGGASMANLMFGHDNLKVLALVSEHLRDFAMFSTLAHHVGAQYFMLTGPSNRHLGRTEFHRDVFHGDFWISPSRFKRALQHLC